MNVPKGVRKLDAMHHLFGKVEGRKCKDCPHLIRWKPTDRSFFKCECYGESCGESTDWAQSWTACGLIEYDHWMWYVISERDGCVINMLKHEPREKAPRDCKGQISMDDL